MSRLEDIREKLYRRKEEEAPAPRPETLPPRTREEQVAHIWASRTPPESLPNNIPPPYVRKRRISTLTLVAIGAVMVIGLGAIIGYLVLFPSTEVLLEIFGPSQVSAGEPTVITVRIANHSGVKLIDGALTITFPEGTLVGDQLDSSPGLIREKIEVPDIPAQGVFEKEIRVKLLGAVNQSLTVTGLYLYRPENVSSRLTRRSELVTAISRVPIALTLDAPERVSSGQEVSIGVGVDAEASFPFQDMTLEVGFPSGFEFTSADPAPAQDSRNLWPLGALEPGSSQKITIRGILKGDPEEVKPFHLRVGRFQAVTQSWLVLTEETAGPAIASPFLFTRTTLGGSRGGAVTPGGEISGSVFFKNNLPEPIQNVTITLTFPEKLAELGRVRVEGGFYDVVRRAIVWNPASEKRLGELGPGEEGILSFSLAIKPSLPIRSITDKNFVFLVRAIISSASPPPEYRGVDLTYEDSAEFKIDSWLTLSARASFHDSPVVNSGPLPPKVRQVTTYTVFLQLSSGPNDHRDVEVRGQLGGGVEWRGDLRVDSGEISFNPASQEFTWKIRELPAATGILRPQSTAILQVAMTPAENQVNRSPVLVKGIIARGIDTFTANEHASAVYDLTTELPKDPKSRSDEWLVVP